jgi:hypothetical protein
MRTKKVWKSHQTFQSVSQSVGNAVGICADGQVSDMREPSVISSVYSVENAVGIRADGHVADMRDPSVFVQTDTCQTCVRQPVDDSIGIKVENTVGNPSEIRRWMWQNPVFFFATLCEIPTGYIPSVLELETSSAIHRWMWQNPVIFFQLSVKYRRVIFRRY